MLLGIMFIRSRPFCGVLSYHSLGSSQTFQVTGILFALLMLGSLLSMASAGTPYVKNTVDRRNVYLSSLLRNATTTNTKGYLNGSSTSVTTSSWRGSWTSIQCFDTMNWAASNILHKIHAVQRSCQYEVCHLCEDRDPSSALLRSDRMATLQSCDNELTDTMISSKSMRLISVQSSF